MNRGQFFEDGAAEHHRRLAGLAPLRVAAPKIAGVPPQHPLQLLSRQPATETSPRVFLGPRDECLTETLVQAGAAVVGERRPEWIHPYGKTAWSAVRYSVIAPA